MKRLYTLDAIRGLSVIAMIIFHTLWDLKYFFGVSMPSYTPNIESAFGLSIGIGFVLVSGFSFGLGKRRFYRALKVLGGAACVSIVTFIVMPKMPILFGVLVLMGSMMLIMIPLSKLLKQINPYILLVISLLLFILLIDLPSGKIGIGIFSFNVPKGLYANYFTTYLGFPIKGFTSADYYPLLPWAPLYIAGYAIYMIFERHSLLNGLTKLRILPLEWMGRRSLIIYLVHQPVIYGMLYLVFLMIKRI